METKICIFEENAITFLLSKDNGMMINATEMAKPFSKQVNEFMSNDNTKKFIEERLKNGNSRFISVENESELVDSRQKSGTYMHRILALKFAAWLDPQFELWVYYTIDKLINHYYREHRDAYIEKMSLAQQKEQKKQELLTKYPEALDYFKLEDLERTAKIKTAKALS